MPLHGITSGDYQLHVGQPIAEMFSFTEAAAPLSALRNVVEALAAFAGDWRPQPPGGRKAIPAAFKPLHPPFFRRRLFLGLIRVFRT
jgi:hypothetical protein